MIFLSLLDLINKMDILIDAGNTNIKVVVFETLTSLKKEVISYDGWEEKFLIFFNNFKEIDNVIVSNTGKNIDDIKNFISKYGIRIFEITKEVLFPFKNLYKTPDTLGVDRMVLASGANLFYPQKNVLIIDAGTCITYDLINMDGEYLGGAISPGIYIRYKSLNTFTAKLPLLEINIPENIIGKTTEESIHSGVVNGVLFEIQGYIEYYNEHFTNLTVILTGGNAIFLANQLKSTIFADENFLLKSLYQLFLYNQEK